MSDEHPLTSTYRSPYDWHDWTTFLTVCGIETMAMRRAAAIATSLVHSPGGRHEDTWVECNGSAHLYRLRSEFTLEAFVTFVTLHVSDT